MPPKRPKDHCSYGLEPPGLLELCDGGGGLGASLGSSDLVSFPFASFVSLPSFDSGFNSFAPPGLKYFSKPFGGFSQNSLHSSNTALFKEKLR